MAILTALIAAAASHSPLAGPLVILATHELPTKFESGILARSYPDWKDEAEREGYVIEIVEGGLGRLPSCAPDATSMHSFRGVGFFGLGC